VSAIAFAVPSIIIKVFLTRNKFILKFIGLILTFMIFAVLYYIVLVSAALMGIDEANKWSFTYLTSFTIDMFLVASLVAIIKSRIMLFVLSAN